MKNLYNEMSPRNIVEAGRSSRNKEFNNTLSGFERRSSLNNSKIQQSADMMSPGGSISKMAQAKDAKILSGEHQGNIDMMREHLDQPHNVRSLSLNHRQSEVVNTRRGASFRHADAPGIFGLAGKGRGTLAHYGK